MCRKLVVTNEIFLGTRAICYEAYSLPKGEVVEIHTNTLIPMVEEDCLANLFYIVIGTHKEKGNTMYDVISSRYERTSFTEEKVKTLLDMHIISAGAKLENGAVVVASLEKPTAPVADGKQKEDKEKSDTL